MSYLLNRRTMIATVAGGSVAATAKPFAFAGDSAAITNGSTPRAVAESYWRAECARDIEKVGQHYHVDAVFNPPGERLVGWDNIRKWYEASFKEFPGLEVEIVHAITMTSEGALEWHAWLTDAARKRHPLVGVNIVKVDGGRFREVRSYFDSSQLKLGKA